MSSPILFTSSFAKMCFHTQRDHEERRRVGEDREAEKEARADLRAGAGLAGQFLIGVQIHINHTLAARA